MDNSVLMIDADCNPLSVTKNNESISNNQKIIQKLQVEIVFIGHIRGGANKLSREKWKINI